MVRVLRFLLLATSATALAACAGNEASSLARKPASTQVHSVPVRSATVAAGDAGRTTLLTTMAFNAEGSRSTGAGSPFFALGFSAAPGAEPRGDFALRRTFPPVAISPLAGRTLPVSHVSDIQLADREVVLTFDDGPVPRTTPVILDTLKEHGVGATFLMVGGMARTYPALARRVAEEGHTIGTHTQTHKNLAHLGDDAAFAEIHAGQASVARALLPGGLAPAPFFRFPYLADRPSLRQRLAREGVVAIDVDVDSKDYFQLSASALRERTLHALAKQGRGIILMHDIHHRTAEMLPGLLQALQTQGYKVVRLVPATEAPLVATVESRTRLR